MHNLILGPQGRLAAQSSRRSQVTVSLRLLRASTGPSAAQSSCKDKSEPTLCFLVPLQTASYKPGSGKNAGIAGPSACQS